MPHVPRPEPPKDAGGRQVERRVDDLLADLDPQRHRREVHPPDEGDEHPGEHGPGQAADDVHRRQPAAVAPAHAGRGGAVRGFERRVLGAGLLGLALDGGDPLGARRLGRQHLKVEAPERDLVGVALLLAQPLRAGGNHGPEKAGGAAPEDGEEGFKHWRSPG